MATNTIRGTRRGDVLLGTEDRDRILALGGGDLVYGDPTQLNEAGASVQGANDRLTGGRGGDAVYGDGSAQAGDVDDDDGEDAAEITGGNDRVDGSGGSDALYGDGEV